MKTLLFLAAFVTTISVQAQGTDYAYCFNAKNFKANILESMARTDADATTSISTKTLKNFSKEFHNATNAEWFQLKNSETMCRFFENGILNWAFYQSKGNIIASVKGYSEKDLPADVRRSIKSTYYDYNITFTQQINMPGVETVYIVHLEDAQTIKVLRLQGDEIDVLQELKK
jgi:hypothetical protein